MYTADKIPLFQELAQSQHILLAGAGGGFDIFCGIPLYYSLKKQGKTVILANYSFTWLKETSAEAVRPSCYLIREDDTDRSGRNYFPEKYLKAWFALQGDDVPVYAFERTGIQPLKRAYDYLIRQHQIDTIILIDGGTDSLMFGDEQGLGTPQEDICSMAAVFQTSIKRQLLVNLGFGVDHFHGVSHFRFLENVAALSRDGGYLGAFQLLQEMTEVQQYLAAVEYANIRMPGLESIVSNSISSAIRGQYGDHHTLQRTNGNELWINPLMAFYWCFHLQKVMARNLYYNAIKDTRTIGELNAKLSEFRDALQSVRAKRQIPI